MAVHELVQLPKTGADGLALGKMLHEEKQAEEEVKKGHFPAAIDDEETRKKR